MLHHTPLSMFSKDNASSVFKVFHVASGSDFIKIRVFEFCPAQPQHQQPRFEFSKYCIIHHQNTTGEFFGICVPSEYWRKHNKSCQESQWSLCCTITYCLKLKIQSKNVCIGPLSHTIKVGILHARLTYAKQKEDCASSHTDRNFTYMCL